MADGSIKFDTRINTSAFKQDIKTITANMKQLQKEVTEIENTLAAKRNTLSSKGSLMGKGAKQQLQAEIAELESSLQVARNGFAEQQADLFRNESMLQYAQEIEKTTANLDGLLDKQQEMIDLGTVDTDSIRWQKLQRDIDGVTERLSFLHGEYGKLDSSSVGSLSNALSGISEKQRNIAEIAKGITYEKMIKSGQQAKRTASGVVRELLRMKNLIRMRLFRSMIGGLMRSFRTAFNELVQKSTPLNEAVSNLMNSFSALAGAIVSAFAPLITALSPIFTWLIDTLTSIVNLIGQFIAYLSGKNTYTRAVKGAKNYASSLKGVGGSAKSAKKENEKALASFDEINQLNLQKDEGSGGGSGGGSGVEFEEVPIDTEQMEGLKKLLNDLLPLIAGVATAWALWHFPIKLANSLILGISIAIAGAIYVFQALMDIIENGLNWQNLTVLIGGLALVVGGLALAFGTVGLIIGVVIAAFVAIGVAIYDFIRTGELTNEQLTLITVALLAIGAVIAFMTGSWIPLLIAAVASMALWVFTHFEDIKKWFKALWDKAKEIVSGIAKTIMDKITGLWKGLGEIFGNIGKAWSDLWKGASDIFVGIFNSIVSFFEKGINALIDGLNSFGLTIPSWVPFVGGNHIGVSLSHVNLPRLATGTVVPANAGEFTAILGDNKHETEIVSPLSTMKQALLEALAESGSREIHLHFDGELAQFVRMLKPELDNESRRIGTRLIIEES